MGLSGAEAVAIRSPLSGAPGTNNAGPTPRFVGDLWWCTASGGTFTANNLYLHDGTAWRWLSAPNTAPLTNSLAADVPLNNTANYFDGPSVAQGAVGTWFASGTVTVIDPTNADAFAAKLWDGTTVKASTIISNIAANNQASLSLSGCFTSPTGNIRISVRGILAATGAIKSNTSGVGATDSTITAFRLG